VRHFAGCLRGNGTVTLPAAERSWSAGNLLALAGVCNAMAAGNLLADLNERKQLQGVHREHVEAVCFDARDVLFAAAQYVAGLSMLVLSGQDTPATRPHDATISVRDRKWSVEQAWTTGDSPPA
jgi:hypothetical protein